MTVMWSRSEDDVIALEVYVLTAGNNTLYLGSLVKLSFTLKIIFVSVLFVLVTFDVSFLTPALSLQQ